MNRDNGPKLAVTDAKLDQLAESLKDYARADVRRWAAFVRKIRGPSPDLTPEEVALVLGLADFGATVITGRVLGRKV